VTADQLLKIAAAASETMVGKLFKSLGASHVRDAILQSEQMRHPTLGKNNMTLTGGILSDLFRDVVGVKPVIKAMQHVRRNVNDLDVGMGAVGLGPEKGKLKGVRRLLFLDKDNAASIEGLLPGSAGESVVKNIAELPGIHRVEDVNVQYAIPSATKVVKATAPMLTSILAYGAANDAYKHFKQRRSQA